MPFLVVGLFLTLSNPFELPLGVLLIPFAVLALGIYMASYKLARLSPLSARKSRFIAGSLTSVVMLLILLQSIRQLSAKDFVILAALLIGLIFYVRRIDL